MVIKLNSNLFEKIENLKDINHLLSIFSENRRYDYFCELSKIKDTDLFKSLLKLDRDLIEEYFNRFITIGNFKFDNSVSQPPLDNEFSLEEAIPYFRQPLLIILENSLNDGHFVDFIIDIFKSKGKKVRRHKKNVWIRFGNAGGCTNIPNFIEAEKKNFNGLPKDNHKYLRCFVLIDSDKRFPSEQITERTELRSYLDKNDIPYHELEKREMENYLPDDVIANIENNDEYIRAFLALTPIQKDYFNIEEGFKDKNFDSMKVEIKSLYDGISNKNYKILRKQKLNFTDFKSKFPKLFNKANRESILLKTKHQSNPNELENILKKITNLL